MAGWVGDEGGGGGAVGGMGEEVLLNFEERWGGRCERDTRCEIGEAGKVREVASEE